MAHYYKDRKNILKMSEEVRMLLPKKDLIQVEYIGKINNYYDSVWLRQPRNTLNYVLAYTRGARKVGNNKA